MTFDFGFNFRSTAVYVTDPANSTYVEIETYPTTRGGATFGWINSPGGSVRNRSTTIDPRIAGVHYHTNAIKNKFQLDLPASGSVDIYCAVGDYSQANLSAYLEVFDDTTSLGVIVSKHLSNPSNNFYDATDTAYNAANWPGSNAKATFTFATTTLVVAVSPGDSVGSNFVISHLRAAQVDSGIALTGAASTQANTSSAAAITQAHALLDAASTQANTASSGTITQSHVLADAGSTQGNVSSAGAITLGAVSTLVGAASTQDNASGTGAITQTHVLTASTSTNSGTSSAVAITQIHVLTGANATQGNLSGTGAMSILVPFVGAPSTQANISGVGQITRAQTLTAANAAQANLSGTGAISSGTVVEAALTTGITTTVSTKKPGIPTGTPFWLKTMLEIIVGRRGNAIPIPPAETLTFSDPPTQAECQALYAYLNKVRTAQESLINRLDG